MPHYRICGLTVASEVELPGVARIATTPDLVDVTVRRAAVPDDLPDPVSRGPNWAAAGRARFLLRVPGVARFLVTGGREIAMDAEDRSGGRDAVVFLLGSVLGVLLNQRGSMVLHAGSVAVNGKAVLFCGPSGIGKSTLVAALSQAGFPYLSDDLCCIGPDRGQAVVQPDGRTLKLWADSVDRLGLAGRRGEPVRRHLEKFYVEPPRHQVAPPTPVGAVYALRERPREGSPDIQALNMADAAQILNRCAYRPRLVANMGLEATYFAASSMLQGSARVFNLTRPGDFTALPGVLSALQSHWRQLGLLRAVP